MGPRRTRDSFQFALCRGSRRRPRDLGAHYHSSGSAQHSSGEEISLQVSDNLQKPNAARNLGMMEDEARSWPKSIRDRAVVDEHRRADHGLTKNPESYGESLLNLFAM
jgi:hypothetical protein